MTVIDGATLKVAARIRTGAGRHEIAFASDDLFAFVTNEEAGTVSVISIQKLAKVKDIKAGPSPVSIAFSPLSKAAYIASAAEGTIAVLDTLTLEITSRIKAKPGLKTVRFAPDARWGFATNIKEHVVYIFDSATNTIAHTVGVGASPDQVAFTEAFAYVRSLGSEQVSMIPLIGLDKGDAKIIQFPGGQYPPEKAGAAPAACAVTPAPEGNTVMVANPADKMIYYYQEGMVAPMGNFQNYRREPKAVLIVDRSLRETAPGVYSNTIKLPAAGLHDVAFLMESPRLAHCFEFAAKEDPALKKEREIPVQVLPLLETSTVQAGEEVRLRFKLIDAETKQPKTGLKDVGVLTFLAPGIWQKRQWAAASSDGVYEAGFIPPEAGMYYVFVECPSLKVRLNQLPYLVLEALDPKPAPAKKPTVAPQKDKP